MRELLTGGNAACAAPEMAFRTHVPEDLRPSFLLEIQVLGPLFLDDCCFFDRISQISTEPQSAGGYEA